MKQIALAFIATFLAFNVWAQESPSKALKAAKKALTKYNMIDQAARTNEDALGKLKLAKEKIDFATSSDEMKSDFKAWLQMGNIYQKISQNEKLIAEFPNAVNGADKAFSNSLGLAKKKYETKSAIAGLMQCAQAYNQSGIDAFNTKDYKTAYSSFNRLLTLRDVLKKAGNNELLADDKTYNDQLFYTASAARLAGEKDASKGLYMKLYENNYESENASSVYSSLFSMLIKEDESKALEILEKGKEKYPDNTELLFAEINYYLGANKVDILESKLQEAIEKDPENESIHTTLGQFYEKMYNEKSDAGDQAGAAKNFTQAEKYYQSAIDLNPSSLISVYSMGALYYNKAVAKSKEMQALSSDFSPSATKKYNALKVEMNTIFDKALPYFLKSEGLDSKDLNTLIALKEIYALKDDLTKSNEYKSRIEAAKAGN